jgi:hypothetical protein
MNLIIKEFDQLGYYQRTPNLHVHDEVEPVVGDVHVFLFPKKFQKDLVEAEGDVVVDLAAAADGDGCGQMLQNFFLILFANKLWCSLTKSFKMEMARRK